MASYGDVLAAFRDFRIKFATERRREIESRSLGPLDILKVRMGGVVSAILTPLLNVHATGVGVRVTKGKVHPRDFVLKIFVYEKYGLEGKTPKITRGFGGIQVDVEPLPVLRPLAKKKAAKKARRKLRPRALRVESPLLGQGLGQRIQPIIGGASITPLGRNYVGTLGCFLRRIEGGNENWFALSNNHVLSDVDRLTEASIAHPGSSAGTTNEDDVFARYETSEGPAIPIAFPGLGATPKNRFDAAVARVVDVSRIDPTKILNVANYKPQTIVAAIPGMRVVKSGHTTQHTKGHVTAFIPPTADETIDVEYGPALVATFRDVFAIQGDNGPHDREKHFSSPGDSGSLVLTEGGHPVGLLFAGAGNRSFACDLHGICSHFRAFPA